VPVWLFSVGLGPALVGPIGRWFGNQVPPRIEALRDWIGARGYQPFAGHYERAGVDLGARTAYRLMGGPRYGDLRDWAVIRRWSESVGDALHLPAARNAWVHP
jgi:menaquinone-dependent protoporphyrinogen oxidase